MHWHVIPYSDEDNLQRMNTSVKLNELIVAHSKDTALVIINLPGPPPNPQSEQNCILPYHNNRVSRMVCMHGDHLARGYCMVIISLGVTAW